jgi:hypothetical protein
MVFDLIIQYILSLILEQGSKSIVSVHIIRHKIIQQPALSSWAVNRGIRVKRLRGCRGYEALVSRTIVAEAQGLDVMFGIVEYLYLFSNVL